MDSETIADFYVLEISVEPGGARKHNIYLMPTLVDVYNILQKDLVKDAGLVIWYGETILLHRCCYSEKDIDKTKAIVIETIDLHNRITLYVGNFSPIKFNPDGTIIGYFTSELGNDNYISLLDESPIDFTSKNVNEVYRYLMYDMHEIFRIMKEQNINGTDMERYPPNVGVQIDLSSIPRINKPLKWIKKNYEVNINGNIHNLSHGCNSFE